MRFTCAVVLLGCVALTACGKQEKQSASPQPAKQLSAEDQRNIAFWKDVSTIHFKEDRTYQGNAIPGVSLIDQTGRSTTLTSLRGKPLLVNFWARWCVPCRAEMPTIDAMTSQRGSALQVVAVNEDAMHPTSKSLGELAMNPAIVRLTDVRAVLTKSVASQGLPTTVLYGSDGRERWRLVGVLDWTKPQAQQLLKEAT